jgi:2'-5' RNA ligase
VYSLNIQVPAPVAQLASNLARDLPGAHARTRDEHTLLVKRLGGQDGFEAERLPSRVRQAILGTAPFEVAVTGVEVFEEPETGTGPVVYLAVESPGLVALHERLCEEFEPVAHLEGDEYVPHVTIARGGDLGVAKSVAEREVEAVTFEVTDLVIWDAERSLATTRFSLPA